MAAPSVTYTFTNGTTADGTQVNTNFTDLINGMSDGTKDFTINNLTANGNLTFSGNGTFGSASNDTLTFNGSLASSIPINANATYDIGSATLGLAGIYLGANTRSIRLVAGAVTGSYTITFPVAVPSLTGKTMIFNTSATAEFRYADKFTASKTTTYTATGDETIIPCDATSASFTVSLPPAATCTGKQLKIIKTDSDFTKVVTIDADASETINGATTTTLNTQYECVTIASDGTGWHIVNRRIPGTKTAYTPAGSNFGTISNVNFLWWRENDMLWVRGGFTAGTVAGGEARLEFPSGLTATASTPSPHNVGTWATTHATAGAMTILTEPSATYFTFSLATAGGFISHSKLNGNQAVANSTNVTINASVRITGWST